MDLSPCDVNQELQFLQEEAERLRAQLGDRTHIAIEPREPETFFTATKMKMFIGGYSRWSNTSLRWALQTTNASLLWWLPSSEARHRFCGNLWSLLRHNRVSRRTNIRGRILKKGWNSIFDHTIWKSKRETDSLASRNALWCQNLWLISTTAFF